jgi:hypothetical protein
VRDVVDAGCEVELACGVTLLIHVLLRGLYCPCRYRGPAYKSGVLKTLNDVLGESVYDLFVRVAR